MPDLVDCRGLSCPEPVIMTRHTLINTNENSITVMVSSATARDNVTRAAKSLGWNVSVEPVGEDFKLLIGK